MHLVSLHPIDPDLVQRYVTSQVATPAMRVRPGDPAAAIRLTHGLATALSQSTPAFVASDAFGLTFWEAQVDRPLGMLMRPPARLFIEAGLDVAVARAMPTRLDFQMGMMGGAYIPARLIDQACQLLDEHMERSVQRLVAAEYDPVASMGLMYEAFAWARSRNLGLYEALDVMGPAGEGVPASAVIRADRKRLDRQVAARIEAYRKPPKKPGLFQRMLGRGAAKANANGHLPEGER